MDEGFSYGDGRVWGLGCVKGVAVEGGIKPDGDASVHISKCEVDAIRTNNDLTTQVCMTCTRASRKRLQLLYHVYERVDV